MEDRRRWKKIKETRGVSFPSSNNDKLVKNSIGFNNEVEEEGISFPVQEEICSQNSIEQKEETIEEDFFSSFKKKTIKRPESPKIRDKENEKENDKIVIDENNEWGDELGNKVAFLRNNIFKLF